MVWGLEFSEKDKIVTYPKAEKILREENILVLKRVFGRPSQFYINGQEHSSSTYNYIADYVTTYNDSKWINIYNTFPVIDTDTRYCAVFLKV